MIVIKILSGPYAGREREIRDHVYEGVEIEPLGLLRQLVGIGSRWQVDYSRATEIEKLDWGRADLMVRIMRALRERRPVRFMGSTYHARSAKQIARVGQQIEDAIVTSGYAVTLEYDDERGVSIATGEREHPLM